ncbi:LTA synthase family protein [Flavobacterium sp. CYK-55]|uniref:LTA synthase family protein n=1 Tax=Flavobacterium sp. CYK-55 TaxID=2835529 RepID=UPI001BCF0919|nr:LTA synthase family protein [Flavobacterium sp. CYK-55]MBS7787928.1 LTA synthase family protein [Flavobacterium sp. CYK-55]
MNQYYRLVKLLSRRIFVIFCAYQLCRIVFIAFNKSFFPDIDANSFLGGAVFDLSAIGFTNLLFVLLHLLPGSFQYRKGYQKGLKIAFFTVNLIFLATNFVDFEYFKFTGRRSSFGLITAKGMEHEIGGLIPMFLMNYWYLPLGFIIFAIVLWKLLGEAPFTDEKTAYKPSIIVKQTALMITGLGICFLMARGGINSKPIRIVDAVNYTSIGNTAVVLNTPYSILKTLGSKETLTDPKYYTSEELDKIFNPVLHHPTNGNLTRKNVVIIILESFGDENIHIGQTPFLDSLITKSYYFKNAFANGKVSIDAVPSTMSSVPSLMNSPLISSAYALNEVYGLPKILKKNGYSTSFFHGAFNGSQNFDQYCRVAGFDAYFGKDQYPKDGAFDGSWGIYDEEFLQFFCDKIGTFKRPFFTSIFTISSHIPYTIPERYKGKFPKGTAEIHESVAYTDYALRLFFKKAQKQDWYKNTLFVLTADHTSSSGKGKYTNNVGKFRIPILMIDPSNPHFQGVNEKNFQQIDILPSLLDELNISDTIVTYGKSYRSQKDFVVSYVDNVYNYISGDYYLAFDGNKSLGLYNFKKDSLFQNNLLQHEPKLKLQMERFIKAYIQSFNERVSRNELTVNHKKP